MIKIIIELIIIWGVTGIIVNILDTGKTPLSKNWTKQNTKELKYDIAMGPVGVLMFIIYVIVREIKSKKDKS